MRPFFRAMRAPGLAVCLTWLLAGTAFAQQGQINGVIVDSSGGVIPGVTVSALATAAALTLCFVSQTEGAGATGQPPSGRTVRVRN